MGELTPVAAMFGANVRTIVLIHSMRVITVAFIVPFTVLTFVEHTGGLLPMQQHGTLSLMDWVVLVLCAGGGWLIGWPLRTMGVSGSVGDDLRADHVPHLARKATEASATLHLTYITRHPYPRIPIRGESSNADTDPHAQ